MNAETPASAAAEPVAAEGAPRSPGAMIRAARENARLSLDELAAQTKLARHTLEALERDDFHALLEPVYVRGYYRKCAKVLGLPEAELISLYQNRVTPKSPGTPSKLRLASGTELGSANRLPIAMGILLAVIAIAVCAFLWFARGRPEPVPPSVAARAEAITPEPAAAEPVPVEPAVEPVVPAPLPEGAPASAAGVPAPDAAAATSTEPAPAGTPGSVTLAFEGSSWVRIDDGAGKSLVNGLMRAGDRRVVEGALPLNVFLGNAPGVKVEFQGQSVDVARFTRENLTARFTLPLAP